MALQTRQPTRAKAAPVLLLEGEEGAGKSFTAALLSASPRVNRTYWFQLGRERTADEYAAITHPDHGPVRYELVVHDGTFPSILQQVREAKAEAAESLKTTGKPDVAVLDTVGSMWEMLSEWADNRARSTEKNRLILAKDPNAEIDITSNLWNDATTRWRRLMTPLLTFPGIVVLLSRGRETMYLEGGRPQTGKADYRVEGQKQLTFDVGAWVRMERDLGHDTARIVKLNSVDNAITAPTPGQPVQLARRAGRLEHRFSLERFIFETMGYNPRTANHHGVQMLHAGNDAPLSDAAMVLEQKLNEATTEDTLRDAWTAVVAAGKAGENGAPARITLDETRQLSALTKARRDQIAQAATAAVTPPAAPAAPAPPVEPAGTTHGRDAEHAVTGDEQRRNRDDKPDGDQGDADQLGGVRPVLTGPAAVAIAQEPLADEPGTRRREPWDRPVHDDAVHSFAAQGVNAMSGH